MFRILASPFEAVRADDGVSRRDECISTGRERPESAPRGPGDILEPFSEVGFWGKILVSYPMGTCQVMRSKFGRLGARCLVGLAGEFGRPDVL